MSRRWLIGVSVGAHLAIGVGLFASGVWRLERMDAGRLVRGIAVMLPPPPAEGGPKPGKKPEDLPKNDKPKRKPPVTTQLKTSTETAVTTTTTTDTDTGTRIGDGDSTLTSSCQDKDSCVGTAPAIPACGNRTVEIGEQCDDGNTSDGDGCSSTCRTEVKRVDPITVDPKVMRALRVSGETDVHPSTSTQNQMLHDGTRNVTASFLVCVAIDGRVASTTVARATGYPDYDAALLAAVGAWRYRPYTVGGAPVPACGMVTFNYVMR